MKVGTIREMVLSKQTLLALRYNKFGVAEVFYSVINEYFCISFLGRIQSSLKCMRGYDRFKSIACLICNYTRYYSHLAFVIMVTKDQVF